jgi:hypothetical protein
MIVHIDQIIQRLILYLIYGGLQKIHEISFEDKIQAEVVISPAYVIRELILCQHWFAWISAHICQPAPDHVTSAK